MAPSRKQAETEKTNRFLSSGRLTPTRKQRGLSALLESVTDQHPGRRPLVVDEQRQLLEKQLLEANRQIDLLNHKMALKDVLMDLKLPQIGSDRAKKMIGSNNLTSWTLRD